MHLTRLLMMSLCSQKQFIQNIDVPSCKNCKYFLPYENDKQDYDYGKCKIYGTKNIISGIIKYEYASHVRHNEKQCGKNGTNFEQIKKHPFFH